MKEKLMDSKITRLVTAPFPMLELQYLLNEKNDKQKRHLLGLLNLHLKVPKNKPFPTGGLLRNVDEARAEGEKNSRKKTSGRNDKLQREREPFLQGCKVAVIGGQAKWFESVVRQTGADFVHENGENPERIFAELKKSNVLFKLITATSHGAIWAGVEIAKAHGIPHFLIEGSKSNLRMQLWEKRHLIRGSLPGQERAQ